MTEEHSKRVAQAAIRTPVEPRDAQSLDHQRRAYDVPQLMRFGTLNQVVRGASAIFPDVGGGKDPTPG